MGRRPAADAARRRGTAPLTAFLDTNVLIRRFTGDPRYGEARDAALPSGEPLLLSDLIVPGVRDVSSPSTNVGRERVSELMRAAIAFPSIATIDPSLLLRPLEIDEVDRLDFADLYLVAQAEATGVGEILSIERAIDRVPIVKRREP